MNKYQEALDRIKNQRVKVNSWEYRAFADENSDLDTLQELVDKATPMKPIKNKLGQYIITYTHECSKCGNYLEFCNKYCSEVVLSWIGAMKLTKIKNKNRQIIESDKATK